MKRARPSVKAVVTFLTTEDGGRQIPPNLNSGIYRPHIVIQSPDVRAAIFDADGVSRETYQGAVFVGGPGDYRLGASVQVSLELCYFPDVPYDDVVPGATFTVREGHRVVAHGQIESRSEPPPPDEHAV